MFIYIEHSLFQFCILLLILFNLSLDPILSYAIHYPFFILLLLFTFRIFLLIQNILKLILQIYLITRIRFELMSMIFKSLQICFIKLRMQLKRRLFRYTISSIYAILFLRYFLRCYYLGWWIFVYIIWNLQFFID